MQRLASLNGISNCFQLFKVIKGKLDEKAVSTWEMSRIVFPLPQLVNT